MTIIQYKSGFRWISELEVLWWASTNEVPVDVMEFLELPGAADQESWHNGTTIEDVEVLLKPGLPAAD